MEFLVEPMKKDHVASVVALERACRLSSRGEEGYLKLLEDERWLLLIVRESTKIVAVFSAQMVADELQIDNIAVAESFRQQRLGTTLLTRALERAKEKEIVTAILEVRSGNLAAVRLYGRQGFAVVGRRKDYYHDPPDDALLMSLNLSKHS
jgi:ribosomal-protein-alanine N-acetyltransferase